jgi:hypothetical protein
MTRDEMIQRLKRIAPIVTEVTGTSDMGFEFSAVVPDGVICAEPGMLLNYSGGEWPPNEWEDKTEDERATLLRDFLLVDTWEVTSWDNLSDEEIEAWLGDAEAANIKV